jgi:hypothetical protein
MKCLRFSEWKRGSLIISAKKETWPIFTSLSQLLVLPSVTINRISMLTTSCITTPFTTQSFAKLFYANSPSLLSMATLILSFQSFFSKSPSTVSTPSLPLWPLSRFATRPTMLSLACTSLTSLPEVLIVIPVKQYRRARREGLQWLVWRVGQLTIWRQEKTGAAVLLKGAEHFEIAAHSQKPHIYKLHNSQYVIINF